MDMIQQICCPAKRDRRKVTKKKSTARNEQVSEPDSEGFPNPNEGSGSFEDLQGFEALQGSDPHHGENRTTFLVPDSPAHGPQPAEEGGGLLAGLSKTMFDSAAATIGDPASEAANKDKAEKTALVAEFEKIAAKLEGPVSKHPSCGRSILKKVQKRYVVVVPDHTLKGADDYRKWKAGTLSWWETEKAFSSDGDAKGFVPLLKIAKVDISKDDAEGKSVLIKHRNEGQMQDLILVFFTSRDADAWSYALWEFISLIRGQPIAVE